MSAREILAGKAVIEIGLRNRIEKGLKAVSGKLRRFSAGVNGLGGALAGLGGGATAAFSGLAGALLVPTQLAAGLEQTRAKFETMLGSGEKANAMLAELKKFAASTPMQFEEIADAAQKLLAFGVDAKDIPDELRRIGDVASAIGAPIGEISEIYGKAKTQGRLFAEDINQLTGRGIPIIQELAKQFGVAESAVKDLVKNGDVNFEHLQQAFVDLTGEGGKFAGMMEKQSQTLLGRWSTFKDNIVEALVPIGVAVSEMLKPLLRVATTLIQPISALIKRNAGLAKVVAIVAAAGVAAGLAILTLGGGLLALGSAVGVVATLFSAFATIASVISVPVLAVVAAITALVAVYAALAAGMLYVAQQSGALGVAVDFLKRVFGDLLSVARDTMAGILAALDAGEYMLAAQILWAGLRLAFFTGADRVLEGFVYLWENAWKLTKQFVVTMGKLVMSAAASIRDMLISGLTMSASGVKAALASLFNSANTELSLSVAMDGSVDQARGQLNALTSRAQALQRRKQQATNRQPQKRPNANRNQQLQAAEMQRQQRLRMAAYQRQQQALRRQQAQQPPPKRLPQVEIDARRAQQQLKAGIAEADKNACCQGVTPDKSEEVATAAQGGVKKTSKLSSTGTFSAAAATLLGLGTNKAAEQTASNTGKQVRLTQKLLKKKSAGPQFGT